MTKRKKVLVEKERKVTTYAELWHTSFCLLKKGQEDPKGSFHQVMASLVFTAFTLEAYLNHIGAKLFLCWSDLERLSPREKMNVIAEHLNVNIDYSKRPWQVMKKMFQFRNDIAHGKSIIERFKDTVPLEEHDEYGPPWFVQTRWEKYCTEKNAIRSREDVEQIAQIFHEAAGFKDDYPFIKGLQSGSSTVFEE
ncbi:MAG: hypothetical protein MI685_09200 [Chlorobiales bacterium]|nr:hypothetical protein [Chlorobiales bacterium]